MMATPQIPEVPLPPGAVPAADLPWSWEGGAVEYRCIEGEQKTIQLSGYPDAEVFVFPGAVQMADGSIQPRGEQPHLQSGPTVSVQARWDEYMTAAEARQLARYIEEAADIVDRWAGPDGHSCSFHWCKCRWRDESRHWWIEHVPATLRRGDPYHLQQGQTPLRVGVGVAYDEEDHPAVVIHIDGGPADEDVDAHLKLTEAVALRDLLNRSIENAAEALQHMTRQMMKAAGR